MATFTGNNGKNTLYGTTGNDTLVGLGDDDTLYGYGGNDKLEGGEGEDTLDGGAGNDTAVYDASTDGVTVNLATGAASGGHAEGDTFVSIENLRGSNYADILTGDALDNALRGRSGNDTLTGGAGADSLYGGNGDDTLIGGAGADILRGGADRDTLRYGASSAGVTVNLATGVASGGHAQGDIFSNIENLWGSAHADALTGDAGDNVLRGRKGDDTLAGGAGSDILYGNKGDDNLAGGAGADTLDGGDDEDTLRYDASFAGVTVNLATGAASGGHAEGDTFSNIENIRGSAHADALTGDAGDNILRGRQGDDILAGGAGADILDGGAGADILDGGAHWGDTLVYDASSAGVTVNLATGVASGGDAQGDSFSNIERLRGSAHADVLTGDTQINYLWGLDGADTLSGGGGNDRLHGGAGADTLYGGSEGDALFGGAGADTLYGGEGNEILHGGAGADTLDGGSGQQDILDYYYSSAGVMVNLATGAASGGDAEGDTFSNIEYLRGSAYADVLTGDGGSNWLYGLDGDDTLSGGGGDDELHGGRGADTLDGGADQDTLYYWVSLAGVTVNLATGAASGGDAEGDTFSNIESVVGSAFADVLTGDEQNNSLWGWYGADTLTGGAGSDTFVFRAAMVSTQGDEDEIQDFSATEGDQLDVSAFGATFIGENAFSSVAGEVRFAKRGDDTLNTTADDFTDVFVDTDGDGTADFALILVGLHDLVAGDFILS